MSPAKRCLVCLIVFLAFLPDASSAAQQQPQPNTFVSSEPVQQLLAPLRAPAAQAQLLNTAPDYRRDEFQTALRWLLNAPIPNEVPPSLFPGLDAALRVLRAGTGDEQLRRAAVDDLILKGTFCRRSPAGLGASVDVNVRTWLDRVEQAGWEVVYRTALEAKSHATPMRFAQHSSPTGHKFAAGRFIVWARDPSNPNRQGPESELMVTGDTAVMPFDITVVK